LPPTLIRWYLRNRGTDYHRNTLIWKLSSQAFRRYICPLNSDQRLCCYAPTRIGLHYHQYFDYISWSVERILIALDAFESPRFTLSDDTHVYGILLVEATVTPWTRYCCILASCDARYIWFLHCQMILWMNSLTSNWSCRHYHCIQDQKGLFYPYTNSPHTPLSPLSMDNRCHHLSSWYVHMTDPLSPHPTLQHPKPLSRWISWYKQQSLEITDCSHKY